MIGFGGRNLAMQSDFECLSGRPHSGESSPEFAELRKIVGFDACYETEQNYADRREPYFDCHRNLGGS